MEVAREALRRRPSPRPQRPGQLRARVTRTPRSRFFDELKGQARSLFGTALPAHRPGGRRDGDHEHHARGRRRAHPRDRRPQGARRRRTRHHGASSSSRPPRSSVLGAAIGIALGFGLARLIAAFTPLPAAVAPWSIVRRPRRGRRRRHRGRHSIRPVAPRGSTPSPPCGRSRRCDFMARDSSRALEGVDHRARRAARQQGARRPHHRRRGGRRLRRGGDGGHGARRAPVVPDGPRRHSAPTPSRCGAADIGFNACDGTDDDCPDRRNPPITHRRVARAAALPDGGDAMTWLFGSAGPSRTATSGSERRLRCAEPRVAPDRGQATFSPDATSPSTSTTPAAGRARQRHARDAALRRTPTRSASRSTSTARRSPVIGVYHTKGGFLQVARWARPRDAARRPAADDRATAAWTCGRRGMMLDGATARGRAARRGDGRRDHATLRAHARAPPGAARTTSTWCGQDKMLETFDQLFGAIFLVGLGALGRGTAGGRRGRGRRS